MQSEWIFPKPTIGLQYFTLTEVKPIKCEECGTPHGFLGLDVMGSVDMLTQSSAKLNLTFFGGVNWTNFSLTRHDGGGMRLLFSWHIRQAW